MAAVAQLKAVVSMDTKAYKAGAKDIQRQNEKMKSQFKAIGSAIGVSFGAAAAVAAVRKISLAVKDWAVDASIAARRVGVLTSEMIALRRVSLQSGADITKAQQVLSKLQSELFRAATGAESSKKKFEDLGLSVSDLASKSPIDMFRAVAKAAKDMDFPLGQMIELFGEDLGPAMRGVLKQVADEGLGPLNNKLGNTADRVEALGSRWDKTWDSAKGYLATLTAISGEELTDIVSTKANKGGLFGLLTYRFTSNTKERRKQRQKELKETTEERKKEQAEAIKQLVKARVDTLTKELAVEEGKMATALERVQGGRTGRAEAAGLERVGASFGNRREGLPVAERQLAVSERQLEVQERFSEKLDEIRQELATARGNLG